MLRIAVVSFALCLGLLSAAVLAVGVAVEGTPNCKDEVQQVTGCLR